MSVFVLRATYIGTGSWCCCCTPARFATGVVQYGGLVYTSDFYSLDEVAASLDIAST